MQRAQIGQKHKITATGPIRLPSLKKRIKLDSPALPPVPKINTTVIKHEIDNNDYSHTTDDIKHSNFADLEHQNSNFPIIKTEPMETYEQPRPQPKKM